MEDISFYVSSNLKRLRELRNLSREELAEITGLSKLQVSNFEVNLSPLSVSHIYYFAQKLEYPLLYFFDGLPLPSYQEDPDQVLDQIHSDSMLEALALIKIYNSLSDKQQKAAKQYFRRLDTP